MPGRPVTEEEMCANAPIGWTTVRNSKRERGKCATAPTEQSEHIEQQCEQDGKTEHNEKPNYRTPTNHCLYGSVIR